MSKQGDLASALAGQLEEDLADDGVSVSVLGVLDALATTGLKLTVDQTGEATAAYQEAITRRGS